MKTKFLSLFALTVLGLLASASDSNAQNLSKASIREFPNPAKETAKIEVILPENNNQMAIISIVNNSGQEMYHEEFNNGSKSMHDIQVGTWPTGLYNAVLYFKNRTSSVKFVVN